MGRNGSASAHTAAPITPVSVEGEGLGSTLVRHGLDAARDAGLAVFPSCPFTAEWIRHHPEYVELVPENVRAAYDLA